MHWIPAFAGMTKEDVHPNGNAIGLVAVLTILEQRGYDTSFDRPFAPKIIQWLPVPVVT